MKDEFYIGWEDKAPTGIGSHIRKVIIALLVIAIVAGAILAFSQRTIARSVFEWGTLKNFTGTFKGQPYPHLIVSRPGTLNGQDSFSSYYLVKPFKFGLDAETINRFDDKNVNLRGTLIYRGGQTMIEVANNSIELMETPGTMSSETRATTPSNLGQKTLTGEIVDSKCYLGVMNPGALITHRACAIRCISGGIPPVLLVRQASGPPLYFLLISRDGKPVNQQVLDLVAEPVEITGDVERQGDLLVLRADPGTYRRVKK